MQLEMGMSMSRYLPATGTAGLDRDRVSGNSREPRPPPRMRARTERMGFEPRSGPGTWAERTREAGQVTRCYPRADANGSGSREETERRKPQGQHNPNPEDRRQIGHKKAQRAQKKTKTTEQS